MAGIAVNYFVDSAAEVEPSGIGTVYRVRAESGTPGCSHWYRAFVTRRGSLVVTRLDDATGTYVVRDLDGDAHAFAHDDPIRRDAAEAVERYRAAEQGAA